MGDNRPAHRDVPRSTRFLAGLGFVLAALVIALFITSQLAVLEAQNYLRKRYKIDADLPVNEIRASFLTGPVASKQPLPPLGFCWTVELDTGIIEAELSINPWTREVIDWHISL